MGRKYRRDGRGRFAGGGGSNGGSRGGVKSSRKGVSSPKRPVGKKQTTLRASKRSKRLKKIQRFVKNNPEIVVAGAYSVASVGLGLAVGGKAAAGLHQVNKIRAQNKRFAYNKVASVRGISVRSRPKMARKRGVIKRRYKVTTL
jgi:hypothetical protein